ncbi:hypothetical protein LWI28_011179 [Acer negundo]|uniref:Ataxin-10 domain-containing protein n=1 Tax=Acer negundo TaxID=4023 RepID=A0AAD5IDC9_ACENE|nr:hypothetical protein LWI28_011179 [Acer negundo]KAK4839450.1 hypothetical protein QYF36_022030 [Acer negundo]
MGFDDEDSLLDFNLPKDVLRLLLTVSSSSSLKETLETLAESSRTAAGRAALASVNILPKVLQLTCSIPYPSGREYLLLSLKLLRNLCAGEISNQNSFIERNGVKTITDILMSSAAVRSDPDFGVIRMGLQVLANVSLAGQKHQQAIWSQIFPDAFVALAGVRSRQTCDPLCMVVYTCCDGSPELFQVLCDKGLQILVEISRTASSVGFGEDWFKLIVSRVCLEDMHFPVLFSELKDSSLGDDGFSSRQGFLLRVVSEIVNERIEEISVPGEFALCVLGIFRKSVGVVDFFSRGKSGLPTDSIAINVLGYSVSILRDICAREDPSGSDSEDSVDVVDGLISSGLIELFLSLLRDLEPPTTIRKAMRLSENQEGTSSYSAKTCPYMGFRKDIVAVIGNCAYRRKHVQDEIRERNGILLLLQQCVVDEENQFLREWGIWSVRNILEGNEENQQVVADLELQGSIDVPELSGLGLKVEVNQQTQRAKLVNVPSKA